MTTRAKPGDLTGQQRAAEAKKAAEAQARREDEITLISAEKEVKLSNTVLTPDGKELSEVEISEITLTPEAMHEIIRVTDDISFFYGTETYNLEAGQRYKVPTYIADHLEEKGYIWRSAS